MATLAKALVTVSGSGGLLLGPAKTRSVSARGLPKRIPRASWSALCWRRGQLWPGLRRYVGGGNVRRLHHWACWQAPGTVLENGTTPREVRSSDCRLAHVPPHRPRHPYAAATILNGAFCGGVNVSSHDSKDVQEWHKQPRHRRAVFHFIPTYSSWLNLAEVLFNLLQAKVPRREVFPSKKALVKAIMDYIDKFNREGRTFRWTKTAEAIMSSANGLTPHYSGRTKCKFRLKVEELYGGPNFLIPRRTPAL